MLTETDLRELLSFQSAKPVLSVYLNTDPAEGSADAYKLRLRSMLKGVELADDIAAIEKFIEHEFDWSGRSIAIFSCAADNFFRTYSLAIPVRDRLRTGSSPHVKPLAELLDYYGGYGVALVDKQGARLFYFHLGELHEQEGTVGEAVRHTKRGGASSMPGRRGGATGRTNNEDEVTGRNMKEAAEFAARFFADNDVRRVVIGGTEDNIHLFINELPKTWQSLVVGKFHLSMTASKDEVLDKALQIGHQAEHKQEVRLIDAVLTNAAKKQGGVVQLNDTLKAVHDGRVLTLVITSGFRAPGFQCSSCGYLTAHKHKKCPFCGSVFTAIPDAVELAVRKVMQHGGEVEVLQIEQPPAQFGNIGAILRY